MPEIVGEGEPEAPNLSLNFLIWSKSISGIASMGISMRPLSTNN
jgi:hypothetical protein